MANKFKAIDDIKKFGKMLEGFIEFSKELESVASFEQVAGEIEQRCEFLNKQEVDLKEKIAAAKSSLNAYEQEGLAYVEEGKVKASGILEGAQVKAKDIVDQAQIVADGFLKDASEKKQKLIEEIKDLSQYKDSLESEASAKKVVLDDLESKIAKIKESLGGF